MATADSRAGLTDEQRQAVETVDVGVAVSAGAGCGKTSVLTSRFLSHLEWSAGIADTAADGGSNDAASRLRRLIAITFTDRAAREMRERIRSQVRTRLTKGPEREADHWLDVLRRLDSAQISTIHAFCGTLLRRYAVEAGLDPRYQLLKPYEASTITAELIDDLLREKLASKDESLIRLIADYDLRGVRDVLTYLIQQRYRLQWDEFIDLTPDELLERWAEFHREQVLPSIVEELRTGDALPPLLRLIAEYPPPHPTFVERCRVIEDAAEQIDDVARLPALLTEMRAHATLVGKGVPRTAWDGATELKEQYKAAFETFRKAVDGYLPLLEFDAASARPAAEAGLDLLRLAFPAAERFAEYKRQSSTLDFDDLLLNTRDLLCDERNAELRKRVSQTITRMLVDECQDTDPLQKDLIDALVGEKKSREKLFLVGDFKQSIYRFRRADPEIFRNWRKATAAKGRLPLSKNFRSRAAILQFVNALFSDYFGAEYEPLQANRTHPLPSPAIEFLWATPAAESEAKLSVETLRRVEADWIARWIRARLDSREPLLSTKGDDKKLRPVEPGDVALLFRSLNDAAMYESALDEYGIPYYVVGGKAFYGQQEIYDLLNLLRVLDSTCDEVALAGVLRSPFFSLRDDTLFLLAQHRGGLTGGFFAPQLCDELSVEERARAEYAAATIRDLRQMKNRLPIAALLNEILRRTAYDAILTAEFLGDRKLANLHKLIEMAREFDRSKVASLTEFIGWLNDSVAQQPDEAPAAVHAEKSPVVRLMTIHQSKGLEFPVVFLPDLQRRENADRGMVAFHERLGPLVRSPVDEAPSALTLFRRMERTHDAAESVRLFYVAVTRAADMLVLSAGLDPSKAEPTGWRAFLGERFDLMSGKFLKPAPGLEPPAIRVTTERPSLEKEPDGRGRRPDWDKLLDQARSMPTPRVDPADELAKPLVPRADARRKYSFSRLSGNLVVPSDLSDEHVGRPSESKASDLEGDVLGTLVHAVLATIDFARPDDLPRLVRRQLARVMEDGHSAESAAYAEEATTIIRSFLATPRAKSLAQAQRIHRELEFVLTWPLDAPPTADSIYLQGFLDCLYLDAAGKWRLIDYKTHRAAAKDTASAAEPYRLQLYLYALAMERIVGQTPDELAICFLRSGREHPFPWDDAARTAAVDFVNQSLPKSR